MTRTTGYHVWLAGLRYWHATLAGAERRFRSGRNWCANNRQIIDVETGALVAGWPQ